MTRNLTLAGYAVLGLAMVAYQLIGIVGRRTATLGQALQPRWCGRSRGACSCLRPGWAGWHLFVRADWG